MKVISKKTILATATVAVLATLAYATFTGSTRLRDGGSDGALHIAYSRDSGTGRFAFLKRDVGTGTYQVYVAGTGITGDALCSTGLLSCTRPAISRDGKIVTYWAATDSDNMKRAYYNIIGTSTPSAPVTINRDLSTQALAYAGGEYETNVWPPQATNIRPVYLTFSILFVNRKEASPPTESNCTINAGNDYWKNGQLYIWDGQPFTGTAMPAIVSVADNYVDGCDYLVTSVSGDDHNIDTPARIDCYTINNANQYLTPTNPVKITWSTTAGNQLSTVSQNHMQIIYRDLYTGARELISKDSSGTEGDADSSQQSMTGDANALAFASYATNLTSYMYDTNLKSDIFQRNRSANTTICAYDLSLNNAGTVNDGNSFYPVISGNGNYIAFHSYSTDLVSYYTSHSPAYGIAAVPYCFMSRFVTSGGVTTGSAELASYLDGYSSDWRTGSFPAINYDGSKYGFHSGGGDLASSSQSDGYEDIYELTGFY